MNTNFVICPLLGSAIKLADRKQLAYWRPDINKEADLQINLCTRGVPPHPFSKLLICRCRVWLSVLTKTRGEEWRYRLWREQANLQSNSIWITTRFVDATVSHHCAFPSHCSAVMSCFPWSREVILPWWFWSCCRRSTSSLSCQGASCIPPPPGKAPSHTTTSQLLWMLQATKRREMVRQVTFT